MPHTADDQPRLRLPAGRRAGGWGRAPRVTRCVALVALTVGAAACFWSAGRASAQAVGGEPNGTLSETQQRELRFHLGIIRESKVDLAARRESVIILLEKGWPVAARSLVADLTPGVGDAMTKRAIAQGVAGAVSAPPDEFAPILFSLLQQADEPLLSDVAAALGRYADHDVAREVMKLALDPQGPPLARRGTVLTLVQFRTQSAVGALMQLIEPSQPADVRQSAFAALADLTGITDYKGDVARWQRWWKHQQKLSPAAWFLEVNRNFARRSQALEQQKRQLETQLLAAQSKLVYATKLEDRPALLVGMLSDPLPAMRDLAIKTVGRLQVDGHVQLIGEELRLALRKCLDDSVVEIRQQAAAQLRLLPDELAGAAAMAQRLSDGTETEPAVLREYLLTLARTPHASAVPRLLILLGQPDLRADAARALASAVEQQLLDPLQIAGLLARVREQLPANEMPDAQVIALLGRVGSEDDWQRITAWLDSDDQAVKSAAADAWANSQRSLAILAERAGDPDIRPIVIAAASRRGKDPQTLAALVKHKPAEPQQAEAWRRALFTMAGRVPPHAVVAAAAELRALDETPALREQMLTAAIEKLTPQASDPVNPAVASANMPTLVELHLARAEARLDGGDAAAAEAEYQRIATVAMPLDALQQRRRDLGLMSVRLAGGDLDAAQKLADKILASDGVAGPGPTTVARISDAFLATARRALTAKQNAQALKVLTGLRIVLSQHATADIKQAIATLEAQASKPAGTLNSPVAAPTGP